MISDSLQDLLTKLERDFMMHSMRQLTARLVVRLIPKHESYYIKNRPSCIKNPIIKVTLQRLSTTVRLHDSSKDNNQMNNEPPQKTSESNKQPLAKLVGKLRLMFTCKKCGTRSDKVISKLAYEKGVVIVRCDGCLNNHLIADNLGWFAGQKRCVNIEQIMAKKGEMVRKVLNDKEGYMEAVLRTELNYPENTNQEDSKKTTIAAESSQEKDVRDSEDNVSEEKDKKEKSIAKQ